jgi:metal-responsive CopG/Arc/MetJ family transcriptional regulator
MPTVKTAISLPEPLFQRAEVVAHELQISRSQLVATAVADFLKHYERKALVEAINQAFEDEPPTSEEKKLLQGIRATQRKRLESEG